MSDDDFKGGIHALAGGLAAAMFFHNLKEWAKHRDWHHGFNTGLYGLLWGFENYNARGHWTDRDA